MTLIMYNNGILSADRRNICRSDLDEPYNGFENASKIYVSPDNRIAMATTGNIPSDDVYKQIHERFLEVTDALALDRPRLVPKKWLQFLFDMSCKKLEDLYLFNRTIYFFARGRFFRINIEPEKKACWFQEHDLVSPRIDGSGIPAASVLIRSGEEFTLERFYRIVSAATEGVSPNFDAVELNSIVGF